jgi:hypothetical protein
MKRIRRFFRIVAFNFPQPVTVRKRFDKGDDGGSPPPAVGPSWVVRRERWRRGRSDRTG